MRQITVEEARQRFGSLIDELKLDTRFGEEDGSFVLVQDGKPVGMVMGREGLLHIMDQQREWMQAAVAEALNDPEPDIVIETDEELDAFIADICHRGRERIEALVAEGIAAADRGDVREWTDELTREIRAEEPTPASEPR